MSAALVDYQVADGIATIALARAPVNAIDHPMIGALHAALRRADEAREVRAILLTSSLILAASASAPMRSNRSAALVASARARERRPRDAWRRARASSDSAS